MPVYIYHLTPYSFLKLDPCFTVHCLIVLLKNYFIKRDHNTSLLITPLIRQNNIPFRLVYEIHKSDVQELLTQDIEILHHPFIDLHDYIYVSIKSTSLLLLPFVPITAYTNASILSSYSPFGNVINSLATSSASGRKNTCHFSSGYSNTSLNLVILSLCGLIKVTAHHIFFKISASLLWNHTLSKLITLAFHFLYRLYVVWVVFFWLFSLPFSIAQSNT